MLDNRTKNILDLNDIKEVMVETMLSKYNEKALTKNELTKFFKYMNLQQKNNTSRVVWFNLFCISRKRHEC